LSPQAAMLPKSRLPWGTNERVLAIKLDVTRLHDAQAAVDAAVAKFGRIDVLVNNAGYTMLGALEEVSDEQTQQVFDVNVFGALRMIRAVVPHMRKQRSGRIINISSIAGKLSTPVNGTYSATKFALEALSDALYMELTPFGIQVVLVELGAIKTHFDDTAQTYARDILLNIDSPYQALYKQSSQFAAGMRKDEPGPEVVSEVIEQAMEAVKPKARYLAAIPFPGRLVIHLRDFIWGSVIRQMFKINPSEMQP